MHEDQLTNDQQNIATQVTQRLEKGTGSNVFLDAPERAEKKTFLENVLPAKERRCRSNCHAVATSAIRAHLLDKPGDAG